LTATLDRVRRVAQRHALRFAMTLAIAVLPSFTWAATDPTDDALRVYAVNVVQHPEPPWPGYGIYLGKGLVITAAHVVGHAALTRPSVRIAGLELAASVIKEGAFDDVDLTLLSVDEQKLPISLQLRRLPLCQMPLRVGQPVIVAVPEGTARSQILTPSALPVAVRARFPTVIKDVATTGNSGSGVFDLARKCLLGIMSRKIQVRSNPFDAGSKLIDLAKYFVPAKTISEFIPSKYRF
jgi:Trypsin-like peptidase domain